MLRFHRPNPVANPPCRVGSPSGSPRRKSRTRPQRRRRCCSHHHRRRRGRKRRARSRRRCSPRAMPRPTHANATSRGPPLVCASAGKRASLLRRDVGCGRIAARSSSACRQPDGEKHPVRPADKTLAFHCLCVCVATLLLRRCELTSNLGTQKNTLTFCTSRAGQVWPDVGPTSGPPTSGATCCRPLSKLWAETKPGNRVQTNVEGREVDSTSKLPSTQVGTRTTSVNISEHVLSNASIARMSLNL